MLVSLVYLLFRRSLAGKAGLPPAEARTRLSSQKVTFGYLLKAGVWGKYLQIAAPPSCDRRLPAARRRRPGGGAWQPSTTRLGPGGVPIFRHTPEGQAERLAYYEARKLNHLPDSLYDYHDVIHGRETPAERRAHEGRTSRRR